MRLIFVNRFFHPDHSATSQMLTDLTAGLAEEGHDVTVVTSRLSYDDPNAGFASRERFNGVGIERVWTSRFGRAWLPSRTVDYLTFYISSAWVLARKVGPSDVLVAMTDPPAFSIVAAAVAKWRGAALVNWLQDIFPEVAEALQVGGWRSSMLFAALRAFRNASLRYADANVAIGAVMAARLRTFAVDDDRIEVIPNWADTDAVRPVPHATNKLRRAWIEDDEFVVGYSGNLGRAHEVGALLEAMAMTAEPVAGKRKIRWLFVGGGAHYERLKRESARIGLEHVTFRSYQPREALAESLSVADVHIVSLRPELEGLIVPSKFYGIAAVGRPTIFVGSAGGEIARLIAQYDCGVTVDAGDGAAVVAVVTKLAELPDYCRDMGERARTMCEERFSKAGAIAAWRRLIEASARKRPASSLDLTPVTPPIEDFRRS